MRLHPGLMWAAMALCCASITVAARADDEAAYTRVITERADKIVSPLAIADSAQAVRVRGLIVDQYRNLRTIHDALETKTAEAENVPGDRTVAEAWIGVARKDADLKLFGLHRRFVAQLSAELTPEQLEQVKDGMTYGVLNVTYRAYVELLPTLSDEQRKVIRAQLVEAREYAMDAGSAEEKHAWFGKYKGRINNYLSAEGYDLKQAEKELSARRKAARSPSPE